MYCACSMATPFKHAPRAKIKLFLFYYLIFYKLYCIITISSFDKVTDLLINVFQRGKQYWILNCAALFQTIPSRKRKPPQTFNLRANLLYCP